jgi:hypothetical protein
LVVIEEIDGAINITLDSLNIESYYSEPQNLLLIILIIVSIVMPLLVYYFERSKIPKLVFDGVWKKNVYVGIGYYVKVKTKKGEGRTQGVQGFVGIKDKQDLNISSWHFSKNKDAEITTHDYLVLFNTFDHNGNKIITFPNPEYSPTAPFENNLYNEYKDNDLIVRIEATRGRISKRMFMKKIDDIVNQATELPP